jgi:multisubunit Na+/H+ antiporter MnhG subunit
MCDYETSYALGIGLIIIAIFCAISTLFFALLHDNHFIVTMVFIFITGIPGTYLVNRKPE